MQDQALREEFDLAASVQEVERAVADQALHAEREAERERQRQKQKDEEAARLWWSRAAEEGNRVAAQRLKTGIYDSLLPGDDVEGL